MKTYLRKSKGFTLIELIVVVVILGVLAGLGITAAKGKSEPAKAAALLTAANEIATSMTLAASNCNVSTQVASNVLPDSANSRTLSDVLIGGKTMVATAYQSCFDQVVKPLSERSQVVSAGVYSFEGYTMSLAGGGTNPLDVTFAAVPDTIVLILAQKYNPSLTTLAAQDNTSLAIRYGSATNGARDVTFRKNL